MLEKAKAAVKPYALLPVRFGLGLTLLIHGWSHATAPGTLVRALERADLPRAELFAWGVVGLELLGGALILAGFQARLAAFVLAAWLFAEAFVLRWSGGWFADSNGFEHPLLLALCALGVFLGGPGRASVDSIRGKA